jgi:hypothetical protein
LLGGESSNPRYADWRRIESSISLACSSKRVRIEIPKSFWFWELTVDSEEFINFVDFSIRATWEFNFLSAVKKLPKEQKSLNIVVLSKLA